MSDRRPDARSESPLPSEDAALFRPTAPVAREPQPVPEDAEATVPLGPPIPPPPPPSRARQSRDAAATILRNWPAAVVLALLAGAALIVPTMTQIATTDDWGYTRSVEILLDEGRLTVFPVVAATAVGQILWGALFGGIFGMSLGMMRVSTVVMVALGGVALYAILRQLGVSRGRSALGMAVWLFNPLTFALAFSFMTDAHFASVMLISLAFYLRGLRPDDERLGFVLAGAFFAGFAFLIRQQGALIPLAVGMWLLLSGRFRFRREDLRRLLAVALLPALMLVAYYAWLRWFNDVPDVQENFLQDAIDKGWSATWLLARRIPLYAVFYSGLLLAPVLIAVRPWRLRERGGSLFPTPAGYYAFAGWAALVLGYLYMAGTRNQQMPFAAQFVGPSGLGPPDVLGGRQRLWERGSDVAVALTVVAAAGALLLGMVLLRRLFAGRSPERWGFWLVVSVGFWQLIGVFPPSYHYTNRGVTLDRYLLPVIAILIVLAFYALRDVDLAQPLAWLAMAAVAAVSIAGARDYLVFMDAVWDMAESANENGVPNVRLDAGSGWDGYHLYTLMLEENITEARSPQGSPWWIYFYAKPTDSSFIVATEPDVRRGYVVADRREYDQWLDDDTPSIYLLRRWYLPYPVNWAAEQDAGGLLPGVRSQTTPGPSTAPATPVPAATPAATPD